MITEKELLQKKKEIERTKQEVSELKGGEKSLLKQLQENWNCKTLAEAKVKIKQFEKDVASLDEEIKEQSEELETLLSE